MVDGNSQIAKPPDTRLSSARSCSAVKSQQAWVTRVLEYMAGIAAEVLCESVRRLDTVYKEMHAGIDWKAIAGIRNVLVHDYFDVGFEAVWNVVTRDLPPLQLAMRAILVRLNPEG